LLRAIRGPVARHFERSEKSALVRRVWEHRTEVVPGFTRKYGIKQLAGRFLATLEMTRFWGLPF
jgi:hypothetical protein